MLERGLKKLLIILFSAVLTSSFGFLLALQAGADIMLSLLDFSNNASFLAAALESLKSAFQRFVFFDADFRHWFSLPPTRLPVEGALSSHNFMALDIILVP